MNVQICNHGVEKWALSPGHRVGDTLCVIEYVSALMGDQSDTLVDIYIYVYIYIYYLVIGSSDDNIIVVVEQYQQQYL